ncbi:hypothetical protein MMAD_06950 [Mycolicibacterium madagascariense]|uniref:Lipoprotein LpqJ n=1 Tax=Mycolicibacterium madagascariense TaxID=212765 RepID=A0A7I7XAN7_9MYCO|nr:hypothetical protein [Mycolicibacterium madagascariense]MCV7014708.1 hypothetical protein [Mycolicibacterium madagascariense]BBZ26400.1 hypothetical protein MMAD_06950 [Mycolicibacterium madagascariense]
MRARLVAVSAIAVGALLAGCQSTVPGNPQGSGANPAEPSVPTSQPTRTTPSTPPPSPPSSPSATAAPPRQTLAPQNGYVFIATRSGQTRCQISSTNVGCEAPFSNAPQVDGEPANGVEVTADGHLRWILGNLGDIPVVTIDYSTYSAQGWTIVATEDGTRFTNDATHHGMSVATQGAEAF